MANTTQGPARQKLDATVASTLEKSGVLIHDDRKLRSRFFDGRFLTAKDLTREQAYFLTRQADLGRAGGVGVVSGLRVTDSPDSRSVTISKGHGVTPSGEIVVLMGDLAGVRFDDIPTIERLDAAFGLSRTPREPARNRSGLFVLALRPVEYTANPVASYPTALGDARKAQDGDIIEAVAVTLIPYPAQATGVGLDQHRARAAHDVFVRNAPPSTPVDALPLAMIALERGVLKWVDEFLVRREVGSEQADFLGLGGAPRALREAHLQQYKQHLSDVIADRQAAGAQTPRFLASEYFQALPAAGPLPAATIDPLKLSEGYFPPDVDVELSVIPEDELGALLEESLFLPPVDLTLTGEQIQSTSVVVLVPVPRSKMIDALSLLTNLGGAGSTGTLKLRSSAPGLTARRTPLEALGLLTKKWSPPQPSTATSLADAAWRSLIGSSGLLWYARRKSFSYKPELIGLPLPILTPPDPTWPEDMSSDGPVLLAKTLGGQLLAELSLLQRRTDIMTMMLIIQILEQIINSEKGVVTAAAALGEISRLSSIEYPTVYGKKARYQDLTGPLLRQVTARITDDSDLSPLFEVLIDSAKKAYEVWELSAALDALELSDLEDAPAQLEAAIDAIIEALQEGTSLDEVYHRL